MKPIRSKPAITVFLMAALTGNSTFAVAETDVDPEKVLVSTKKPYPSNVYFGDTHQHTSNSADAFMNGNRMGPEEAYRFAMGEKIISNSGVTAMLSRPLDFLVVADHAEGLGLMYEVYEENPAFMKDKTLQRWSKAMKAGGEAAVNATNEVIAAQAQGTLPSPLTDPKTSSSVMKTVWEKNTAIAEQYNDPGKFTAMIGYEWTSVPGGNNLHRNILYRGNKRMADQMMPFNSWQSQDPEKLWDWMERYEKKTGDRVLAIPHNGNLSNGRMFESVTFDGKPITKEYAKRRARWEVLQEVMQTKGNSETHPLLSPKDEFANFGIAGWDYGNLTLEGERESSAMRPYMYLRSGLLQGLIHQKDTGENPFKFGMIGGTDVHNTLSAVEEENYMGKHVSQEPKEDRWNHVSKEGLGKKRYFWQYESSGYAGVWAHENTRESLWEAMKRKEVYATSGTRLTVRFFGGWEYSADDANNENAVGIGYSKGVPMGGDLPLNTKAKTPTFLVSALKDPLGGNLDRIQVVKGWLDEKGESHEKIFDVVWGDSERRNIGSNGKLTPVGDTVNVSEATWSNSIGDPQLSAMWKDPEFNRSQPSFYYLRVIEIPTPRWTAYDQKRFGIKIASNVPMKHQERAWSSPIWYTPQ